MNPVANPVVRPKAASLPPYPPTVLAASTETNHQAAVQVQSQFFAPSELVCYVRCCQPGCHSRSPWRSASHLTFRVEELENDPILCAACVLRYPNLPAEQISAVWIDETEPMNQMYRIVCRESRALGIQVLPPYITEKEEIISPRSLFAQPIWRPAVFDDSNRRIYICPECPDRDFRKQSRYIRHVSEHINLYQCRHCHQSKARVEDTKNHLVRTCLPRHYPNVSTSRFDGDENDIYHYSRHYRWRTNAEFLNDSRANYRDHDLGAFPAIFYAYDQSGAQPTYYTGHGPYHSFP